MQIYIFVCLFLLIFDVSIIQLAIISALVFCIVYACTEWIECSMQSMLQIALHVEKISFIILILTIFDH